MIFFFLLEGISQIFLFIYVETANERDFSIIIVSIIVPIHAC